MAWHYRLLPVLTESPKRPTFAKKRKERKLLTSPEKRTTTRKREMELVVFIAYSSAAFWVQRRPLQQHPSERRLWCSDVALFWDKLIQVITGDLWNAWRKHHQSFRLVNSSIWIRLSIIKALLLSGLWMLIMYTRNTFLEKREKYWSSSFSGGKRKINVPLNLFHDCNIA